MMTKTTQSSLQHVPAWNASPELKRALSHIALRLLESLGDAAFYLYGADKNRSFIPILSAGSAPNEQEVFLTTTLSPETDKLIHRMLARPMTLTFGSAPNTLRMAGSILERLQAQFAVAVPVLVEAELIGLLIVVHHAPDNDLSVDELRQVEWLAAAIAPAIQNTRKYYQTLERLAEAEALHQITLAIMQKPGLEDTLKTICDEAIKMATSCGASLALIENSSWLRMVHCAGETPDKPGRLRINRSHLGRAIHHRSEPVIINHSPERTDLFSRLVVPLLVKDSTIGILTLFRRTEFEAEDARLMCIFAGQAAIAIDQAQLTNFVHEMTLLEERHRLSRELHDSVNQLLYGITLYTEAALRQMEQSNLEATRTYLKNIKESGQAALKEMRMLIFGLRPSGLTQIGLQSSLSQRLKSVEEKLGLEYSLKWRVISPLESHIEEGLYGIAQEALNNVIRHAQARTVSIRLAESGRLLTMTIKDDGLGFDPGSVSTGGLGLETMRERAARLNARLRIESQPNMGTRIIVEVAL
jgi:signal transduction histidine kinase